MAVNPPRYVFVRPRTDRAGSASGPGVSPSRVPLPLTVRRVVAGLPNGTGRTSAPRSEILPGGRGMPL